MRLTTPKGEDHPRARFTNEEVKAIRDQARTEAVSAREIARQKECDSRTINRILNRETYR